MGIAERTPPTEAEFAEYPARYSNWGRWGDDDELGTLNFITPEARRRAAGLVRDGRSVSLARRIDTFASESNPYPAHHFVAMNEAGGVLDYVGMFIHGVAQTHIDALCHIGAHQHGSRVYWNDKPFAPGQMPKRHTGTVDFWKDGIVARGVLYDIPRLRGTGWCEEGQPVHGWELADAAAAQGVEPASGDVVVIRSGRDAYYAANAHETPAYEGSPTGVHVSCVEFLAATEASVLVWDWLDAPTAQQNLPNPFPGDFALHVHAIVLPYMGMPIVDNAHLDALAATCAELGRWEFQLVVAPLVIHRGTGSPVNPIAIF